MPWVILFVILGVIGSALEGCSSGEPDDFSIKYVGRERLRESLRDPGSLEIISEEVTPERGYRATFRAKNGFGGYVIDSVEYR